MSTLLKLALVGSVTFVAGIAVGTLKSNAIRSLGRKAVGGICSTAMSIGGFARNCVTPKTAESQG